MNLSQSTPKISINDSLDDILLNTRTELGFDNFDEHACRATYRSLLIVYSFSFGNVISTQFSPSDVDKINENYFTFLNKSKLVNPILHDYQELRNMSMKLFEETQNFALNSAIEFDSYSLPTK